MHFAVSTARSDPRLRRTGLRLPLSRKPLDRQRRASIVPAKADGGSPMSSWRRVQ